MRPVWISTIWVKLLSHLLLPQAKRASRPPASEDRSSGSAPLKEPSAVLTHIKAALGQVPGTCGHYNWTLKMLSAPSIKRAWR